MVASRRAGVEAIGGHRERISSWRGYRERGSPRSKRSRVQKTEAFGWHVRFRPWGRSRSRSAGWWGAFLLLCLPCRGPPALGNAKCKFSITKL